MAGQHRIVGDGLSASMAERIFSNSPRGTITSAI
jgi:hypothetical protein